MTQNQKQEKEKTQDNWLKVHMDMLIIVSTICCSLIWMNGKFNEIEKDIAVIKTVLVMKNILPIEFAQAPDKEK